MALPEGAVVRRAGLRRESPWSSTR